MTEQELLEDRKAVEALLMDETDSFRKFVRAFLRKMKSPETQEIIRGYLEQGRSDLVVKYINDNTSDFNEAILAAFLAGANTETRLIARKILSNNFNVSFDITHYESVAELSRIQSEFIREFNKSNSTLFSRLSNEMIVGRYSIDEAVKVIIENYGLTAKQYDAVQSYRLALENLSRNALGRELRDQQYDGFIRNAIDKGKAFTPTEINRMVSSYRRNMIQSRAMTIARTVSKTALETGRFQAAMQADRILSRNNMQLVKEWRSKRDGKVRYTHKHGNLDGQVVPENGGVFLSPSGARLRYPGDPQAPLKERANCRCMLLRYIAPVK